MINHNDVISNAAFRQRKGPRVIGNRGGGTGGMNPTTGLMSGMTKAERHLPKLKKAIGYCERGVLTIVGMYRGLPIPAT